MSGVDLRSYEVHAPGIRAVLKVRDEYGCVWSVGALLGDVALRHEGPDGIISMSVEAMLRGASVVEFRVIEQ